MTLILIIGSILFLALVAWAIIATKENDLNVEKLNLEIEELESKRGESLAPATSKETPRQKSIEHG